MKTFSAKKSQRLTLVLDQDITFDKERAHSDARIVYTIETELARGGEGIVYTIRETKSLVAKIFYQPSADKSEKLRAMLADAPYDPTREKLQHISIAWPIASIENAQGECLGFLMPYINQKDSIPLLQLYNPRERRSTQRNFTWGYLLRMVENLASIINELHRKGYVIGDLNESNILVKKNALVTLVDCDSIQVPKPRMGWQRILFWQRGYFHCVVGKPEYTPPELQGRDFRQVDRTSNHDNFALAVLIFLMLMEGWHPFSAIWKAESEAPSLEQRIQRGIFPYVGRNSDLRPKYAPPLAILPKEVQDLMIKCFLNCHKPPYLLHIFFKRPNAAAWLRALQRSEQHLARCQQNSSHIYNSSLTECPWCERLAQGIPDSFPPAQKQKQYQLPANQQKLIKNKRRPFPIKHRLVQSILVLFCLTLYIVEIYGLHIYGTWLQQVALGIQVIAGICLLAFPLILYSLLTELNRSSLEKR